MSNYTFKGYSFQKYVGGEVKEGTLVVTVDWDKLRQRLGLKAAFNKGLRSGIAGVGIKAKFIPKEAP